MAAFGNLTMIGDSLFRGDAGHSPPFDSPANDLKGLLTAGGHTATFVGDHNADPGSVPVCSSGGRKISDILADISNVAAESPDTIIISIGTNDLGVAVNDADDQITAYLNALETACGATAYYVLAPNNLSWFHQASWNLLKGAMQSWCSSRSNAFFGDITNAHLDIENADGIGDSTHWSSTGAAKVAAYIDGVIDASVAVAPDASATKSVFKGIDVGALIATASAQPQGSQKAKFCADVVTAIGSNAIYEIYSGVTVALDAVTLDGTVVYRSTVSGALTSSSAGIPMPTQFVEPPSINTADALTGGNDVEVIRNASNSAVQIRTPIKAGGGTGFLTASVALDGTQALRTSARVLLPPSTLDASVGGGSTTGIYAVSTLISDMSDGNDGGWYMEAAPNTNDSNGPGGKYPYVAIGLRSTDGNSYWPGEYLSDSAPLGKTLTDSTNVFLLPWFVVGRAAQDTTGADNVRVQMRAHTLMGLKSDNTWDVISTDDDPITGASWHANFRSPGNETYENTTTGGGLAQIKSHGSGDGGGESIGSVGYGDDGSTIPRRYKWTVHGYNNGTTKTRAQWIAYKGLVYVLEARLIMHDPSGADNRSGAGLLMWMGADWYKNDSSSGNYINEHCHGRLKLITNDWGIFSCSDISASLLTSYPPPGYS